MSAAEITSGLLLLTAALLVLAAVLALQIARIMRAESAQLADKMRIAQRMIAELDGARGRVVQASWREQAPTGTTKISDAEVNTRVAVLERRLRDTARIEQGMPPTPGGAA